RGGHRRLRRARPRAAAASADRGVEQSVAAEGWVSGGIATVSTAAVRSLAPFLRSQAVRGEVATRLPLLVRLVVLAHRALTPQRASGAALGKAIDHLADEAARLLGRGCGRRTTSRRRNLLKREHRHRVSPRR